MSDEIAKLSLALSYPGPGGESRKVPATLLEAPFQAINVGRIDIPDGALLGAPLVIPFGSVGVGASLVLIKNANNQDLALFLAGATDEHCRIPPGGVFLIGGSTPSTNALTEVTLELTADQVGDGFVDYWVFGDSGDQSPSSAGLSLLDAVLAAFAGTARPLDIGGATVGTAERFAREDHVHGSPRKDDVQCIETANVADPTLVTAADGVTLTAGQRVAFVGQTDKTQNGIYSKPASGPLVRATDFDDAEDIRFGSSFSVLEGATYAGSEWRLTSPTSGTITLGTTDLVFERTDSDALIPRFSDPGAHASATGVYTEATLTFASSIDSSLTNLNVLYTHDNGVIAALGGGAKVPLLLEMHGYNGVATEITTGDARRAAQRGFAVGRVELRGRNGDSGSADDSARELYDLIDAIAAIESAHGSVVDTTKIHLLGFSGGGANTLALVTKFPGLAITAVSCFGFGDYGASNSRSFWALSTGDQATIETRIGNRLADIKPYVSRNANLTIGKALPLSSTKLVMLWDSADTQTFALQRETRDALLAAGVAQSQWYWQESTDGHWAHGYVADNANLMQAENVIFNRLSEAAPTFAKVGTIDVNGYIVTPAWELWTGDPTDYDPRTSGNGGKKHRVRVDFDETSMHFSVRSLTGACNVTIRRRSNGLELAQALAADATATFELDQAKHLGEAIIGTRLSYSTLYGVREADTTEPESGETVVDWLELSGNGSTLPATGGTPLFFPTPKRVLFDASSKFAVDNDIVATADFWFAFVFSLSSQTNYAPVCWFDKTDGTVARVNLQIDSTHVMCAIRNTAGTDVYATKAVTLVNDQWYLAICERIGSNFSCTVNNLSAATVATPGGTIIGNRLQVGIGRQAGSDFFGFAGYGKALAGAPGRSLSAGERARLYQFAQLIHGVV
jgi:pimeloyl-ACP methyl ester carboxylesterase